MMERTMMIVLERCSFCPLVVLICVNSRYGEMGRSEDTATSFREWAKRPISSLEVDIPKRKDYL
jgi:hypothetical protein